MGVNVALLAADEFVCGLSTALPYVEHCASAIGGAKSGQLRTVPLLAVVADDDLAVIGSNWGRAQAGAPEWQRMAGVASSVHQPAVKVPMPWTRLRVSARRAANWLRTE
jgi:hypothetical protein